MDPSQHRQLATLLRSIEDKSPEERTRLLDEVARRDPELAAHLSLRVSDSRLATVPLDLTATIPMDIEPGLPSRFEVRRMIGEGGFGTVYEAFDRQEQCRVAVKVLRKLDPEALYRFKQEFRMLADFRHSNLIRFHELSEYRQVWFFSMELLEGRTLLQYVRSMGACDFGRLRSTLVQLAKVLEWLHQRSVLHRDIKPENIMVTQPERLVLLDFGLARHLKPDGYSRPVLVGTPAYMAPEQMSGGSGTEAADWYAVGAVLYQALTGRLPFEGDPMQVLRAKSSADPPHPGQLAPGTPSEWDELCVNLLARDPEARASGADILAFIGSPAQVANTAPPSSVLIGREGILTRLLDACEAARAGSAVVVDVQGGSGFGKSTLIRAFAGIVGQRYVDAMVLQGRCYEQESMPFKGVDALMDELSRRLRSLEDPAPLPADVVLLAQLFPVLGQVPGVARARATARASIPNAAEFRRRAFLAFSDLLDWLCSRRLVVLCLDDLQWGDADSAALLQVFLTRSKIPPIVIVTTYGSEDLETDFVRLWREQLSAVQTRCSWTQITLDVLDPKAALDLAQSLCFRVGLTTELAAKLALESQGNPLLLEQLTAHAAHLDEDTTVPFSATLGELVKDRIGRLSEAAREILEMLAAAGQPLPESVVFRLVPTELERSRAISQLISQGLIRTRETSEFREIDIYHDQIRGALIENMREPSRAAVHLRIAEVLASVGHNDHGMIAIQYAMAGERCEAARHALDAAAEAETVLAFNRAAQFYAIALSLGDFDNTEQSTLSERLAKAYAAAGRGRDAAEAFLHAAEMSRSSERSLDLRRRAAEQWIQSGYLKEGVALLRSLGAQFDIHFTENRARALTSIAWSRLLLRIRGMRYQERAAESIPARELARLDLYWALTAGLALWNPLIGQKFQLKYERIALDFGEPRRVALALALEGGFLALPGERGYLKSRSLLEQAIAVGRRLDDPHIIGFARAIDGVCSWLTGRWDRAREAGQEAECILQENCARAVWELSLARNALMGGLIWSGQWKFLKTRLNDLRQDAQDRGDLTSLALYRMNSFIGSLASDSPEEAAADLQDAERILAGAWSNAGFHIPHFFGTFGRAQIALYQGRPREALECFERNRDRIGGSLLMRMETFALLAQLLEASVVLAVASEMASRGEPNSSLLDRARRCARAISRRPAVWSAAISLLIEGGIEAASGQRDAASGRWYDAQKELERVGMRMYAAAAQYCSGRISGNKGAVEAAEVFFREQNVVRPDRVAAMLAPGSPEP